MPEDTQPHANEPTDYTQPVAYDREGRPLYAHPPQPQPAPQQAVHFTRAIDPVAPVVSEEIHQKHEQSRRHFPHLNLSAGEYVISAVRRHPIGLLPWIGLPLFVTLAALAIIPAYVEYTRTQSMGASLPDSEVVAMILLGFAGLSWLIGLAGTYIYVHNKFFLTNESVIQEIRISLFAHHEQTVSLANIEDASYKQNNIIEQLFGYGTIRLSTEGDETTYRFAYVSNPKRQIAILNNAVEAFKNGRPIGPNDQPS
jgi:hypothetical protein